MISIKKVAVTPLPDTEGAIIDSFNTTDDKHTNAPSINAVESKISTESAKKQNKVLSGTSAPSSSLGNDGDIYLQYS